MSMVRKNRAVFWCMEVAGGLLALTGWYIGRSVLLTVGLILCAADVLFAVLRFRCPFCRRFLGVAKYESDKVCPHCGTSLGDA